MGKFPSPQTHGDQVEIADLANLTAGTRLVYCAPSIDLRSTHMSDAFVVENTPRQLVLNRYLEGIHPIRVRWGKALNTPVGDPHSTHYLAYPAEENS